MFEKITQLENLFPAYYLTRLGKRDKEKVCRFDFFLEPNLAKLRFELLSSIYNPSPYTHFTVYDPKTRQVAAPVFRDRVIQHTLVAAIEPLFEKKFIYDSYACRGGKGTHLGAKRVKKFLMAARCINGRDKDIYVLQCDIKKYFQSINWDILIALVAKTIHCQKTFELIKKIITTHRRIDQDKISARDTNQLSLFSSDNVAVAVVSVEKRKGLPIGNLTSQLFANIYLNELDHFVKEGLRQRWYARYMDDFLIIHPNKEYLKEARDTIRKFLIEKLDLNLHPRKVVIKNVKEGVPFVGYRIFYDHMLVRGNTLTHMQRKYNKKIKLFKAGILTDKELQQTQSSLKGHLKHANTYRLSQMMFAKD